MVENAWCVCLLWRVALVRGVILKICKEVSDRKRLGHYNLLPHLKIIRFLTVLSKFTFRKDIHYQLRMNVFMVVLFRLSTMIHSGFSSML